MAYYFKHDDNARRDPKLIKLRRIKGMKGIGIYWCLIEILHEQNGEITFDEINSIAFELQEDEANVLSIIKEFDLFVIQQYKIGNTRVLESLSERHEKSKRGRDNVKNRWDKQKSDNQIDNTTVLQKKYSGNTIIEEKRREEKRITAKYLFSLESWVELICMNSKNSKEQIKAALENFINELAAKEDLEKSEKEIKQHFVNWLKYNNPSEKKFDPTAPYKTKKVFN